MTKFNRDELIQKLMGTFLDELDEHVVTLNDGLLMLEKSTPKTSEYQQQMRCLFRAAHSLKGAARSVDAQAIESVCHEMEEFLGLLKTTDTKPGTEVFQILFTATESVKQMGAKLRKKQKVDASSVNELLEKLKQATTNLSSSEQNAEEQHRLDSNPEVASVSIESKGVETTELQKETQTDGNQSNTETEFPSANRRELTLPGLKQTEGKQVGFKEPSGTRCSNSAVDSIHAPVDVYEQAAELNEPVTTGSNEAQSLRVSSERLDHLLALSSELLTSYRRTETWQLSVEELSERLRDRLADWQPIEKQLRMFIEEGLDSTKRGTSFLHASEQKSQLKRISSNMGQRLLAAPTANTKSLKDMVRDVDRFLSVMKAEIRAIGETARLVDEEIRGLRMRPFSDACLGLKLAVRELSISTGKQVELDILGGDTELDRSVLENLRDPLLHIIRNAVQHGIELPQQRKALGKSPDAVIQVSASLRGQHVQIEVRDDGQGINEEAVKAKAKKNGLAEPQTQEEIAALLFMPWFSTSAAVDHVSGRGVGLDVVASQVAALQGDVALSYEPGKGTCFTLTVPLTLTKIRVLLVRVGEQTFALPSASVQRLLRIQASDMRSVEGGQVIPFDGSLISVCSLNDALKLSGTSNGNNFCEKRTPAVVLVHGGARRAFLVDELIGEQEVVVTNLGTRLQRMRNVSGATLLASGEIALILNTIELMRRNQSTRAAHRPIQDHSTEPKQKRLIICDDSPTTRILEMSILQSAGYEVTAVADGQDAWELLQVQGADLIVSDVEMPIMDGFSLARTIRASEKWKDLPLILVTGLAKESDRENGLKAGANAYVVKSEFDQSELIEAIEQFV